MEEVLPIAWYCDEKDKLPIEVLRKAFDAGMVRCDISKKYGGQGLSLVDSAPVTEEIGAVCSGHIKYAS